MNPWIPAVILTLPFYVVTATVGVRAFGFIRQRRRVQKLLQAAARGQKLTNPPGGE